MSVDVNDENALSSAISKHDVVISLIPYTYHAAVIKAACKHKVDVVTTSYVSDAIRELASEIEAAGITVMNEIGLDPGLDHLYAVKAIDEIHKQGGQVKSFLSYCGGLPAPEAADNPLGYKFSWSSRGVLLALRNNGKFYQAPHKEPQVVSGVDLMKSAKPYYINPAFAFVAYPNRDSSTFRESYNIPEAETVIRGTLRYASFPQFVLALVKMGFLDDGDDAKTWLKHDSGLSWPQVTAKLLGNEDAKDASALTKAIEAKCSFANEDEKTQVLNGLRWLGLMDAKQKVTVRGTPAQNKAGYGNPLDTLCATLEEKCRYEPGERDMVMLQHRFEIKAKDGSDQVLTSTLLDYGQSNGTTSMAKLVGVPCAVATRLILEGNTALKQKGKIVAPYTTEVCDPIRLELEKEGIVLQERYL